MGTILVVAPESELRRSVQFALEAEGHRVVARSRVESGSAVPETFDCVVLDDHAIQKGRPGGVPGLFASAVPVVLLANVEPHPLSAQSFRTVLKPLLGAALSDAVADAIQRPGNDRS